MRFRAFHLPLAAVSMAVIALSAVVIPKPDTTSAQGANQQYVPFTALNKSQPYGRITNRAPNVSSVWFKPVQGNIFDLNNPVYLARMYESGTNYTRTFLAMEDVQPTPGAIYNWTEYDHALLEIRNNNIEPIVDLVDPPEWAAFPKCGPFKPGMQDRWLAWVTAAVNRYKNAPWNIKKWIISNEADAYLKDPNDPLGGTYGGACWGQFVPQYADFLLKTANAIHAADSSAFVISSPLASDGDASTFNLNFFEQVIQQTNGASIDAVDAVAFNYFELYRQRWDQFGPGVMGKAEGFRQMMQKYGKNRPIVVAETGIEQSNNPGTGIVTTPADAAVKVAQILTIAQADRARTDGNGILVADWFTMVDNASYVGLIQADGTKRPTFDAFRRWTQEMGGAKLVSNQSEPVSGSDPNNGPTGQACSGVKGTTIYFYCNTLQRYEFSTPVVGTNRIVMWVDRGAKLPAEQYRTSVTRTVNLPFGDVIAARDINGNPVSFTNVSGQAQFTVTDSPIYVDVRR